VDTATQTIISDEVRAGLAALADVVLPGTDRLPSGTVVGAHLDLLDRVLAADPKLVAPVVALGQRAADTGCPPIEALPTWAPQDCETVVFALTAAYYLSAEVKRALYYPGLGPRPIALASPDEICSEDLLGPVRDRGPVFVPAPS
jgi:hypothetical protein